MTDTIVDTNFGHTDQKEHQNLMALTDDGYMKRYLRGSVAWDPSSIADGNEEAKEVTVNGVSLGDFVVGVAFSLDVADLVLDAQVTAADTVTCILANNTGGAIDLGAGTVTVMVLDVT